jgi:O-methyltransferase
MFYWIPREKIQKFQQALATIADVYPNACFAADMLIALGKSCEFMSDPRFVESVKSSAETEQETSIVWRLQVLVWAAEHAMHFPGDFVECGVFTGFCSAVVCKYLDFASTNKTFYLYDTFAGLPEETSTEQERKAWNTRYKDDPNELVQRVRKKFAPYPNVKIVQGAVPESFRDAAPERIAFLHIDMNSEKAEILALEHLFDRLSPGGMLVLDDFGWNCHRAQMIAENAFMRARGYAVLELPTGQGLVIKR